MDLLFSKYASPFLLIDNMIENNCFLDFMIEFINAENEKEMWEYWLHKDYQHSFQDFKDSLVAKTKAVETDNLETTIKYSQDVLNDFKPAR